MGKPEWIRGGHWSSGALGLKLEQPTIYGNAVRPKSFSGDGVLCRVEGGVHKAVGCGVGIIISVEISVPSYLKRIFKKVQTDSPGTTISWVL